MRALFIMAGILAGLAVLLLVLRLLGRLLMTKSSEIGWTRLLSDPDTDSKFESMIGEKNFKHAIVHVLMPAGVHFIKFMSNLLYLLFEGDKTRIVTNPETRGFTSFTTSIANYRSRTDRPMGLALSFIAAFPDIVDWINKDENFDDDSLYQGIEEDKLEVAFDSEKDSLLRHEVYTIMVSKYLTKTGRRLEVA